MMITSLILRAWFKNTRTLNTQARVLADDMLLTTHGPKHLVLFSNFRTALNHTHEYLIAM